MKIEKLIYNADTESSESIYWRKKIENFNYKDSFFPHSFINFEKEDSNIFSFELSQTLAEKILTISNGSLIKVNILLCAGVSSLLYKYTLKENIYIGTSILNQEKDDNLINTLLVLKVDFNEGLKSFKDLILDLKADFVEANKNANYSVELLMEESTTIQNNQDLFGVGIILENIQKRIYLENIPLGVLFRFNVIEDKINCNIEYRGNKKDLNWIKNLAVQFEILMGNALNSVINSINSLSLIPESEKEEIINNLNDNARNDGMLDSNIYNLLCDQVRINPDKIAITSEDKCITYKKLIDLIDKLSNDLIINGVVPGVVIGVWMDRSISYLVSILSIIKVKAIYLPIDKRYPIAKVNWIIRDSRLHTVLIDSNEKRLDFNRTILINDEIINESKKNLTGVSFPENSNHQFSYLMYTSGSTGHPKGVLINQKSLMNYINWSVVSYIKNKPTDFPLFTSISFDLTVTSIFPPLLTGNKIVIYKEDEQTDALLISKIIEENKVDIIKLTPSHLRILRDVMEQGEENADQNSKRTYKSRIKTIISGGEQLDSTLVKDIQRNISNEINIINEYGPTEATVGCICQIITEDVLLGNNVPIGYPIQNTKIYILDKNMQLCPYDMEGELCIAGIPTAIGYLNNPELTHEKFCVNPLNRNEKLYKTGDIATLRRSGKIDFLGRNDQQVSLNGYRIELDEIAHHIKDYEYINDAIVVVNEKNKNKYLVAYYVSKIDIPTNHIINHLKAFLSPYAIPSYYIKLNEIPLTENGKIDTDNLPVTSLDLSQRIPPENSIQKKLVNIISEILEISVDEISIGSNLFALGCNSLKAIIILNRVNDIFNVELKLSEFMEDPCIKGIYNAIKVIQGLNIEINNSQKSEIII